MVAHACSPSYSGWHRRITSAQKLEAAVSHDHTTALQPGQQSKILSQKKKKKANKRNKKQNKRKEQDVSSLKWLLIDTILLSLVISTQHLPPKALLTLVTLLLTTAKMWKKPKCP